MALPYNYYKIIDILPPDLKKSTCSLLEIFCQVSKTLHLLHCPGVCLPVPTVLASESVTLQQTAGLEGDWIRE